jgi:hypothetical protein
MRETIAVVLIALLAACGRSADRTDTTAGADTGVAGMRGMMSVTMMDSMAAHMRSIDTASAASVQTMMPMHRQMAANMVAQMNTEMRSMNMAADARWTALMDSVRQDLVRMPDMKGEQLKTFMVVHHGRLTRLMQGHRDMMKNMKM